MNKSKIDSKTFYDWLSLRYKKNQHGQGFDKLSCIHFFTIMNYADTSNTLIKIKMLLDDEYSLKNRC